MPIAIEAVRAEALFASNLQSSESPGPEVVRHAVTDTLRSLGIGGCAACVAAEFGDHPEIAVPRMTWALATIAAVYPTQRPAAAPRGLPLAS
jgi:hypothetical protein